MDDILLKRIQNKDKQAFEGCIRGMQTILTYAQL